MFATLKASMKLPHCGSAGQDRPLGTVPHALGNILVPLITVVALSYAYLLEGAVLTETVFAWPGIGLYITQSLFNADMNAVLGGTIVVGCVFVGINLRSDLLYQLVEPRAK
jgi:peptide/nickel transport system permease protein